MTTNNRRFEAALLEAIDEALISILGESGKGVVYYYLQNSCTLRKENIPENTEVFIEFLNKLFGTGAKLIENTILQNLSRKLGINPEQAKNDKLTDLLRKIKHE
ncbi:hypothetical protein KEJ37_04540 [Candidatus Bathyarchaeota archaeon]|nr:hypothetical protein [Candidatus Bathyarchaeota archaeon]